jgi:hypothetical protein
MMELSPSLLAERGPGGEVQGGRYDSLSYYLCNTLSCCIFPKDCRKNTTGKMALDKGCTIIGFIASCLYNLQDFNRVELYPVEEENGNEER